MNQFIEYENANSMNYGIRLDKRAEFIAALEAVPEEQQNKTGYESHKDSLEFKVYIEHSQKIGDLTALVKRLEAKVENLDSRLDLCKDCHEEQQPTPLPPFVSEEIVGIQNMWKMFEDYKLDKQRIRMLVKEYKAIINGLGYCSPYWNERVEATLRLAGCDKI